MDPALLEAAITTRMRTVIPISVFGQMADMDPIMEIARKRKLFEFEDASRAHRAQDKRRPGC